MIRIPSSRSGGSKTLQDGAGLQAALEILGHRHHFVSFRNSSTVNWALAFVFLANRA